jgi:hypothetical protein
MRLAVPDEDSANVLAPQIVPPEMLIEREVKGYECSHAGGGGVTGMGQRA